MVGWRKTFLHAPIGPVMRQNHGSDSVSLRCTHGGVSRLLYQPPEFTFLGVLMGDPVRMCLCEVPGLQPATHSDLLVVAGDVAVRRRGLHVDRVDVRRVSRVRDLG